MGLLMCDDLVGVVLTGDEGNGRGREYDSVRLYSRQGEGVV